MNTKEKNEKQDKTSGITASHIFCNKPKIVGYLSIDKGRIRVELHNKPNLWKRFWFSLFFGFEYVEYPAQQ